MKDSGGRGRKTGGGGKRSRRARGVLRSRVFTLELAHRAEVTSGAPGGRLGCDASKTMLDTVTTRILVGEKSVRCWSKSGDSTYFVRDLGSSGGSGQWRPDC